MAKARIELMRGLSLSAHGRTLKVNYPQVITDTAEIRYYESVSTVRVTYLKEETAEAPKEVPVEAPKEVPVEKPVEVPVEVPEEKEELQPEEKPEVAETKKLKKTAYTKETLRTKQKSKLIEIAVGMGAYVDSSDKKKEIIAVILDAQKSEG